MAEGDVPADQSGLDKLFEDPADQIIERLDAIADALDDTVTRDDLRDTSKLEAMLSETASIVDEIPVRGMASAEWPGQYAIAAQMLAEMANAGDVRNIEYDDTGDTASLTVVVEDHDD